MDIRIPTPLSKIRIRESKWKEQSISQKENPDNNKEGIRNIITRQRRLKPGKRGRYMTYRNTEAFLVFISLEVDQIICLNTQEEIKIYKKLLLRIMRTVSETKFRNEFTEKTFRSILSRDPLKLYIIRVK